MSRPAKVGRADEPSPTFKVVGQMSRLGQMSRPAKVGRADEPSRAKSVGQMSRPEQSRSCIDLHKPLHRGPLVDIVHSTFTAERCFLFVLRSSGRPLQHASRVSANARAPQRSHRSSGITFSDDPVQQGSLWLKIFSAPNRRVGSCGGWILCPQQEGWVLWGLDTVACVTNSLCRVCREPLDSS